MLRPDGPLVPVFSSAKVPEPLWIRSPKQNKKQQKKKKKGQSKVSLWLSVQSLRVKEEKDQTGSTVSACFLLHLRINRAKPVAVVPADRQEGREGKASRGLPSPRHSTPEGRPWRGEGRGGVERGRGREQVQQVEPLAVAVVCNRLRPLLLLLLLCFQL